MLLDHSPHQSRLPAHLLARVHRCAAIEKQFKLRALEKFHAEEYPAPLGPIVVPDFGMPDLPGGGFGRGTVTLCDDPDVNPC